MFVDNGRLSLSVDNSLMRINDSFNVRTVPIHTSMQLFMGLVQHLHHITSPHAAIKPLQIVMR